MIQQLRRDGRPMPGAASDQELVECSTGGDRAAYEEIYRRYCGRIHGLCLSLTGDPVEAEVLTQDTFVRGWFALGGFRGQGSLPGWLSRLAVNLWRDSLRAGKRMRRLREDLAIDAGAVTGEGSLAAGRSGGNVVALLTAVDLERCLPRLPEGARTVFVLHDVEGYTHREIAGLLEVATGTVKAQLHRVRRLLREMLDADRGVES
ncbi:MAG: RNA polymerase sigma factor [bacterium]